MGFGLRDLAVNAGEVEQGIEGSRRQAVQDETARIGLEGQRRQNEEAQRQYDTQKGARGVATKAYEDAKVAADKANTSIRAQNEPEVIPSEYGDAYRNKQTGEIFTDKAKAYGVVPEKTTQGIWEKEYAGKVAEYYMAQGMPEKAVALQDWMQTQTGKRYLSEAHSALQQIALGDKQGGLQTLQDLYNSQVRDGRYGSFKDLGGGKTQLIVHDAKGQMIGQEVIDDATLGQRAAQFLSPEFLAQHVLATAQKSATLNAQFNLDVAKERIKAQLHDNSKAQEIALQARAKIIEYVGHAQIDALLGKGAHVTMDQLGQNIVVTIPGQGVFKLEKSGLQPIKNGQFNAGASGINLMVDDLMGSLKGGATGVNVAAPAAPAAPAAAPAAPAPQGPTAPPAGAVEFLKANNSPDMRKQFDAKYGNGMADKVLPPAVPAAPVAPVVPPAPPAPANRGVSVPAVEGPDARMRRETDEIMAGKRTEYSAELLAALDRAQGDKDSVRQAGYDRLLEAQRTSTPASASPFRSRK